jgi:hypothetical protein
MKTLFLKFLVIFIGLTSLVHSEAKPAEIDSFYFLAGLSIYGGGAGCITPPICESFYREGGEQRVAELFLDAATSWTKEKPIYYYQPNGKRLVIEHRALSEALLAFYTFPGGTGFNEMDIIRIEPQKRLSFVAGIYARSFSGGAFHGTPSPAMRATVLILLAEGCEVSRLVFRENEVPNVMQFCVKPSKQVAAIFAAVDEWRAPHVEWKSQ